jgi:hypothetical protein
VSQRWFSPEGRVTSNECVYEVIPVIIDVLVRDAGDKGKGVFVGSFFALDQERQQLYLPYAPRFIRAEYHLRQGN